MPSKKTAKRNSKPRKPSDKAVADLRRRMALAGISSTTTPDGKFAWSLPNTRPDTLALLAEANAMRAAGVEW